VAISVTAELRAPVALVRSGPVVARPKSVRDHESRKAAWLGPPRHRQPESYSFTAQIFGEGTASRCGMKSVPYECIYAYIIGVHVYIYISISIYIYMHICELLRNAPSACSLCLKSPKAVSSGRTRLAVPNSSRASARRYVAQWHDRPDQRLARPKLICADRYSFKVRSHGHGLRRTSCHSVSYTMSSELESRVHAYESSHGRR
jgi:hypothetical protein